jgi:CMP-N,N'-diacetyllegionaminic acid synthase
MIDGKRVLSAIPARGGSRGLPGKNTRMLCGKPLIAWSIDQARASKYVDETMVTTDSEEIAEIARDFGASVPFLRPAELATDTATTFSAIKHTLEHYLCNWNQNFDYLVLMEPTSPLREPDDIDNMLEALEAESSEFDGIVSIGEISEHPSIAKRVVGGCLESFFPDVKQTTYRQANASAFFPYCVAYIVKVKTLLLEETFYPKRCTCYCIKRYQNYEIDDLYDFLCVERVMKHEWRLP